MTYPLQSNNFRSGDLVQGQPLGASNITVSLTADNQFVSPYGYIGTPAASTIFLQSNNATASNRTFTLDNGQLVGQQLSLVFESGSSYTCQLANSGNVKLTAAWEPLQYQSLNLQWDGTYWVEQGRAPASIASTTLANTQIFVGNASNVATAVAMSGDATIANTGAVTIANLAVTTAKINTAAVTGAKLASDVYATVTVALTQANIIAMGVTPVELLPAASAGTAYIIDAVEMFHSYSTAAYTGGGDVQIQYDSGATAIMLFADTLVTATSSAHTFSCPTVYHLNTSTGTATGGIDLANAVAKSVTITNAGGAFAAGNAANTLTVKLTYHVVTQLA